MTTTAPRTCLRDVAWADGWRRGMHVGEHELYERELTAAELRAWRAGWDAGCAERQAAAVPAQRLPDPIEGWEHWSEPSRAEPPSGWRLEVLLNEWMPLATRRRLAGLDDAAPAGVPQ